MTAVKNPLYLKSNSSFCTHLKMPLTTTSTKPFKFQGTRLTLRGLKYRD